MEKRGYIFLVLIAIIVLVCPLPILAMSDVQVWQGQYYTGSSFNTGTYNFNFTVYDSEIGGNICYSNTTDLKTGTWGQWKTTQYKVSSSCSDTSNDYYLQIDIDNETQTDVNGDSRRELTLFNLIRKDIDETTTSNITLKNLTSDNVYGKTTYSGGINLTNYAYNMSDGSYNESYVKQQESRQVNITNHLNISSLNVSSYGNFGGNLSLAQKITFLLGGVIEELIDWFSFSKSIHIDQNLNVTGNITGNDFYGSVWYYNFSTGLTIPINESYQTMTFSNSSNGTQLHGFDFHSNTSLQLIGDGSGEYMVTYTMSGIGTQNHDYVGAIFIDGIEQQGTQTWTRGTSQNVVNMHSIPSYINLDKGSNVTLRLKDLDGSGTGTYHEGRITLLRVGN